MPQIIIKMVGWPKIYDTHNNVLPMMTRFFLKNRSNQEESTESLLCRWIFQNSDISTNPARVSQNILWIAVKWHRSKETHSGVISWWFACLMDELCPLSKVDQTLDQFSNLFFSTTGKITNDAFNMSNAAAESPPNETSFTAIWSKLAEEILYHTLFQHKIQWRFARQLSSQPSIFISDLIKNKGAKHLL